MRMEIFEENRSRTITGTYEEVIETGSRSSNTKNRKRISSCQRKGGKKKK